VSDNGKMSKAEAGRLGGLATAEKYGSEYMAAIGRKGYEVFHRKYYLTPIGTSDFAIVRRKDGKVIKTLNGRELNNHWIK